MLNEWTTEWIFIVQPYHGMEIAIGHLIHLTTQDLHASVDRSDGYSIQKDHFYNNNNNQWDFKGRL